MRPCLSYIGAAFFVSGMESLVPNSSNYRSLHGENLFSSVRVSITGDNDVQSPGHSMESSTEADSERQSFHTSDSFDVRH